MPGWFLVGASAVVLRGDTVLLLRRSNAVDHAPGEWGTPNGRLEPGESVVEALHREVAEEAGIEVEVVRPIDTWRILRGAAREELIGITYLCRWRKGEVRLSDEHDAYRWVPLAELDSFPVPQVYRDSIRLAMA